MQRKQEIVKARTEVKSRKSVEKINDIFLEKRKSFSLIWCLAFTWHTEAW